MLDRFDNRLTSTLDNQVMWSKLVNVVGDLAVNLCVAAVIAVLTFWAAGWMSGVVRRGLGRFHRRNPDPTLQSFGASLTRYIIVIIGVVAILQQLGVKTTSIIAVLGAVGLAVGLALQGALSNVAAGVMILLFRPYRVGDTIESIGRKGQVRALDLFVTEITTGDNVRIVIPNGKVFGDVILNYSFHPRRRADTLFKAPFKADIATLMERLKVRMSEDPRIRKDPPPTLEIISMTEAAVEIAARPWTSRLEEGPVRADLLLAARLLAENPAAELPPPAPPLPKPTPEEREKASFKIRGLGRGLLAGRRGLQSRPKA